jgi:uncharacterized protein (TIGR00661 family)
MLKTLRDFRLIRFLNDVRSLSLTKYDLVISDYEPISAWAAKIENVPCVALSHQASFLSEKTPRPHNTSFMAEAILQHFAPAGKVLGFHFKRYDSFIEPPIIRGPVRNLEVSAGDHITVYLSAYHHEVLAQILEPFTSVNWHIFSPTCHQPIRKENMRIYPVSNQPFLDSLASCRGVMCNAGFETCAEAMYLGKKLLTVPIQHQYEQQCNAAALRKLGTMVLDDLEQNSSEIATWLDEDHLVGIGEIADPDTIIQHVLTGGKRQKCG